MPKRFALVVVSLFLVFAAEARSQQRPGGAPEQAPAPTRRETASVAPDKVSQTSHAVRIDGREVRYTATTSTLPIRLDDGKVAARMFFVAYTKDGEEAKARPVSFLYNGGPGSAPSGCIWALSPPPGPHGRGRLPAAAPLSAR